MNSGSLITLSNLAEKSNNNIQKKIYSKTGAVNSIAFVIFAGATMLKSPISGEAVSGYNFAEAPYIQYIDLDQEKGYANLDNTAIDLMKVENLNKIKKMSLFSNDWNGTGGSAFSPNAISFFETIIKTLKKQPEIAPTGRNSLLMQYELDDKSLLAFEVSENRTEKVYIPKGDCSVAQVEVFTGDVGQRIKECVEHFYGFI